MEKRESFVLLVGVQIGTATVENSMEFYQNTKNGTAFWSSITLLGLYPKNPESPIQRNLCNPMFIATLFTIAECWKQPKYPSVNEWMKNCSAFTQWNPMQQKERTPTVLYNLDGTGEYYTKWNKPDRERQIPYDLICKWNLINNINKWAK